MDTQPMPNPIIPQALLAARIHDPIEKALVLMRTAEGHEGGTSRVLTQELFPAGVPAPVRQAVQRADHWASAADRTAFPKREDDGRYPAWQSVRFDQQPVLIHPLTGQAFALGKHGALTASIGPEQIAALAQDHLGKLIHDDLRQTALAFWRFGPDLRATDDGRPDAEKIDNLWSLLPADTRVPDHTIHDHLDLTAAFAASFAADPDGGPALLAVSLGPVQDFIAAARSTSDLWAGSHLLSRIAWEAMAVICEQIGPEAIIFPRLRGIPQVDLWLRDGCKLRGELFANERWTRDGTDANPLFAAALPNRFTALVPAAMARDLAEKIAARVHAFVHAQAKHALQHLLDAAVEADHGDLPAYAQIEKQLQGFPEVHWASVAWSLVGSDEKGCVDASDTRLAQAMAPFFASQPPGYLGTQAWKLLSKGVNLDAGWFFKPNPGALYPALHELLERALAAVKSTRTFSRDAQHGWRDSLSGEVEWLCTDRQHLTLPPGQRKDTLWAKVSGRFGIKKGEHLGALGTLKRLWPTLFAEELRSVLGERAVSRFVVSTHAMAISGTLRSWLKSGRQLPADAGYRNAERVALPRRLARELRDHPDAETLHRLPGWLEASHDGNDEAAAEKARKSIEKTLDQKLEAYYGLLLMDGDRMGAWLSADREVTRPIRDSFHPQIRAGLERRFANDAALHAYVAELNAATPSRHMAISDALNQFALRLAPSVVEDTHDGRILYAGGDDVMAMTTVADLVPAMAGLRAAYSGIDPQAIGLDHAPKGVRREGNGFALHDNRLLRLMGDAATASCGAVVAHHQAPLGAVLRELRAAEQRAKHEGGRDAFSLTILKRSGGALRLTARWGQPLRCLLKLINILAEPGVSRRAVYDASLWLKDLPRDAGSKDLLAATLRQQFARKGMLPGQVDLADTLAALCHDVTLRPKGGDAIAWLVELLQVAEFLAREARTGKAPEAAQGAAA